ncbi:MAG: peptidase M28 [Sphingomonadales bacterium 35-56-22]|jgi:Zn-dependent M28 family amino/carboxypeptidase|uniref:M28 family metallopeptidase n=1 Tax=Sphingorhabdus sp. TaxID=1902408 RepID=UPI000BD7EFC0|nr:M28 family metallopeptidase [Sphingorhabdus sp.]OYY16153.1 MAG: peptidase M28 [Sphingomonadales bacterium 35-56-22]OYY97659.1 MAG: peptidase M28 [Sphingomonadales bacterium 28-56-43]OYZ61871.1 MAG: peptidase M28 [Sphingomonadales bacterium 24-56-14]OZA84090.1 MAG: peptidase M28 [Sphingomonadales bacterium 39-57-19]HQS11756.1 M28 family metallopeptidase [Sphingorhabdus sp.]
MRLLSLALVSVLALTTACQKDASLDVSMDALPQVEVPALSEATMKDVTRELSLDSYEGRAPGSVGEEKTVAYLISKYKAAGLEPGNNGSWTQDVPLIEITAKNVSALTIADRSGKAMSFAYGSEYVIGSYRETPKTDIKQSEMVFVGHGIVAPEKGWNDYAGVDVKGKTVVVMVNDPDFENEGLDGPFGGKAMTYYGRWTYKYEEAARQGAAAVLIIHDTAPAAYGWNVVNSSWTGTQFLAQSKDSGKSQTQANGWIQKSVAKEIFAAAGQNLDKQMAAAKQKGFKAVPLNLTASMNFENDIARKASKNVIGVMKGTKRPDEYVLYTAHWDHLGRCTAAPDGDDICNGAVDNATGTAALVALAEGFAKAGAPERSVVFLAVTAEESGLLGSKFYAENPIFPLSQTVGGVNMDAFSMSGPAKNLTVIGKGKSQLDLYLEAAAKSEGRTPESEPTPEKGFYYRSDHFSFAKLGVPMVYFEGGDDLVTGGKAAAMAAAEDYEKNRYHAPGDEFDEKWDWSGVMSDLKLYYRIGRMLAMTDAWPNWNDGDEFRAVRDKSRNGK